MPDVNLQFPQKFQCLFEPKRFKALYGGRGAGRSWNVARALLIIGTQRPLRVLCAREFQKSIEESVHRVLLDQIEHLGLGQFYTTQQKKTIVGINGTSFSFEGIKNNVSKIKSFEGIDVCWGEEADKTSKASMDILEPTIRKPNSEIWLTFNTGLKTDYMYQRFVENPDSDTISLKLTWRDNPWFPKELYDSMIRMKDRDPDGYLHVWEGHALQNLEGAIYAKEMREAQAGGRILLVPWEKSVPVNTYWDLGRADNTAIWFKQRVGMQERVLSYYEATGEDITHFLRVLQDKAYAYGDHYIPHDGAARQLGSKKTIQETIGAKYPKRVHIVQRLSLADGINAARLFLSNCWFDEEGCTDGLNALRNYRYRIIDGQRSNLPLHDWASDGADAFRYMAISSRHVKGDAREFLGKLRAPMRDMGVALGNSLGWMG